MCTLNEVVTARIVKVKLKLLFFLILFIFLFFFILFKLMGIGDCRL